MAVGRELDVRKAKEGVETHSTVQCESILLKIFYSERNSSRNFSKKQPVLSNVSLIRKQVLLNSAGRKIFHIALETNDS